MNDFSGLGVGHSLSDHAAAYYGKQSLTYSKNTVYKKFAYVLSPTGGDLVPESFERPVPRLLFEDEYPRENWCIKIFYRVSLSVINGENRWSDWSPWIIDRILFRKKEQAERRIQNIKKSNRRFEDVSVYQFEARDYYLGVSWRAHVKERRRIKLLQRNSRRELIESQAQYARQNICTCGHPNGGHSLPNLSETVGGCKDCHCLRYVCSPTSSLVIHPDMYSDLAADSVNVLWSNPPAPAVGIPSGVPVLVPGGIPAGPGLGATVYTGTSAGGYKLWQSTK